MAIKRNAGTGGSGDYIDRPGEYRVKIISVHQGKTKKDQKPILAVTFSTHEGKEIRDWFMSQYTWSMGRLTELKIAAGLNAADPATRLMDKEVGIAVEAKEPDEKGRTYMKICGYGPPQDVENDFASPSSTGTSPQSEYDDVPF